MAEKEPIKVDDKIVPLPPGAKVKITKEPEKKFRNRWSYRMAKREFKKERRISILQAIGEGDNSASKAKAYKMEKIVEIIKLIIYCTFTLFMVIYGPEFVPELIKNFFGG